jgi:ribosomal-protein-alanine N-acetyltransferase
MRSLRLAPDLSLESLKKHQAAIYATIGRERRKAQARRISPSIAIRTRRCVLRRFSREDIPFIFSASRHPGFCDGMRWDPPAREAELLKPYKENVAAWESGKVYTFTVERKTDGVPLGRIAIRRGAEDWEIGFWTHPDHQGQGYMTEAAEAVLEFGFRTLKARHIFATHALWNAASRRVLEKIGMKFERRVPRCYRKNERWVAADRFVLSAAEWRKLSTSLARAKSVDKSVRAAASRRDLRGVVRTARAAGPAAIARAWPRLNPVERVAAFRSFAPREARALFEVLPAEGKWLAYLGETSEGAAPLLEGARGAGLLRRATRRELAAMRKALLR